MLVLTPTGKLYSTLYGWEGSKEIRSVLKALRLNRSALKDEGCPINEHIDVPLNKMDSARNRSTALTGADFHGIQSAKTEKRDAVLVSPVAQAIKEIGPDKDDFVDHRAGAGRKRRSNFHRSRGEDASCI